ncbi:MAG: cytochrome-c oxidase, cbb3-type subunit III [Woeseia sp.]
MADMPTDFWGGWIAVITLVSLVALGWLVFSVYFSADGEEEEARVWDQTLEEGSNPAPMWWFWLILALMVCSVVYLMLYPGLGSYSGVLRWSQGGRLDESFVSYGEQFGEDRQRIANSTLLALRGDMAVMASARRIFSRKCGICHGYDGSGQASRFPDLTDDEWQWGGEVARIEETIRNGRQAAMIGWGDALGDDGVKAVARYVQRLGNGSEQPDNDRGATLYTQYCVACHGATGEGNIMLGAPSLADGIWLYGGSIEDIERSIALGRAGFMPAFEDRLDDAQIRMLLAWLTRRT